jgi:hypothetical protein
VDPASGETPGRRPAACAAPGGRHRSDGARRAPGDRAGRVSRLELETVLPTTDLVTRYLDALGASAEVRQEILDQLIEQRVEVATWRRLHRAGLREHQQRYGAMEQSATTIRAWTDRVVPGLLQTSDYTREMFRVWDVPGLTDVEGIVTGRVERQEVLRDRTKRFSFLLGEAVLRTPDIPPEVMQEQLDRIVLSSGSSHIEVGSSSPSQRCCPAPPVS